MILLDVTTSYQFRHWKPMGILRVEREVMAGLDARMQGRVLRAIYDQQMNGYYRIPDDMFEELIFRNGCQPVPPPRPAPAPSRLASWKRVIGCLYRARSRSRAVPGMDDVTHRRREYILAEELLRLDLSEYALLRMLLLRLAWLRPGLKARVQQFDEINHRAHFGMMRTIHQRIVSPENRIDPGVVRHYVTAGGFWSDDRYRYAHQMRREQGWTIHALIYDLIPILWAHVAEPTTRKTFPVALHWLLWGVDQIWTISDTTRRDLLDHIAQNGYPAPDTGWIKTMHLGSVVRPPELSATAEQALFARHGLEPGKFVLMVGTQEPRKNPDFAYRLWRELHRRHPGQVMPLVWVGQPGWSIAPLLEMIRADTGLPANAIRILPDIDDDELVSLYRACRFSIYPSHYEGWGLPVVEGLGHGKPCLISDAPAVVEAGAGVAEVIGLFEGEAWLERCWTLMTDAAAYRTATARAQTFRGHSWSEFRDRLCDDFTHFVEPRAAEPAAVPAAPRTRTRTRRKKVSA